MLNFLIFLTHSNVIAADSDVEAQRLFTSVQRQFINLRRGTPGRLQPPVDALDLTYEEAALIDDMLACRAIGAPATVRAKIAAFLDRTQPDELIVTSQVFDHAARLRSFELLAEVMGTIDKEK